MWVTFNGEIYNYQALRRRLENSGYHFRTHSDTEVLVHHFEASGIRGLDELDGMFAFALWDRDRMELTLARDRAGIKPLYYAPLPDGGVIFSSELSALLAHPKVPRTLNRHSLACYFLTDYFHPPHTVLDGVYKLPPGHYVQWSKGQLTNPMPFWDFKQAQPIAVSDKPDLLAQELWDRLGRAVKKQLVSDVPVGVFLSGGIDSSIVAHLAAAHAHDPIQTFSISFELGEFDESRYSREMAKRLGSRHTEGVLRESLLPQTIEGALDCLDEPMADPSIIPTYFLSGLASKHVKVVLSGDGGDEVFGGYPTYVAHVAARWYRRIPKSLRGLLFESWVRRLPVSQGYMRLSWKLKRFILRWDDETWLRHLRWMSNTDFADISKLGLNFEISDWVKNNFPREMGKDTINSILLLDFLSYLPGSVLTKVDRSSMAHGLEVRPVLLDNDLLEWTFPLADSLKVRNLTTKYLLKKAALPHLPKDIVLRRKKGFAIPLVTWLKGPLRPWLEEAITSPILWEQTGLNRSTFENWKHNHQSGAEDRARPLWALIVLDQWLKRKLKSNTALSEKSLAA